MSPSLRGAFAFTLVLLAACARGEDAVEPEAAAARVGQLLYGENLIADPEVNERVGRYIAAVDRDGAPPDSVLPELHAWLVEWAARHPERAARAGMMPRASQPAVPAPGRG
jgi:hypothetical protein